MTSGQLRSLAWQALEGKWGAAAIISLIYFAIFSVFGFVPGWVSLLSFLVTIPLSYGLTITFLKAARNINPDPKHLFGGFNDFSRVLTTGLLMLLYICLWSILLIIPGLVAGYSYRMCFFILHDDPNISASDALKLSKRMMDGNKSRLLFLDLSFIGWVVLGILSMGIGFLWIVPYMLTAEAFFYEELKNQAL